MSLLWVLLELKDDGGDVDKWSYKTCKALVKSSPPNKPTPSFVQARCPSCRPTNRLRTLKGDDWPYRVRQYYNFRLIVLDLPYTLILYLGYN